MTLKGELAHRASLISISFSSQPSLCDNATRAVNLGGASYGRGRVSAWKFETENQGFRFMAGSEIIIQLPKVRSKRSASATKCSRFTTAAAHSGQPM